MTDLGTLTRADLTEAVHREIGLSRAECSTLVQSVLDHISGALSNGQNVKISGFGSFVLRDKPPRVGRNPKTGDEVRISPRRVLTFRASPKVRDLIAAAD
ncbi:MAG: integration host factor subunit alpha [Sphingomonadaceae bacterium]